jgi:hypothetical protein
MHGYSYFILYLSVQKYAFLNEQGIMSNGVNGVNGGA